MTTLLSCETKRPDQDFPIITSQTIQTITKVLVDKICSDTLQHLSHPILFADSLYRFHLAKDRDSVSKKDMLNYVMTDSRLLDTIPFSKADSSFLVFQEKEISSLKLDSCSCITLRPILDLEMTQDNYLKHNNFSLAGFFVISIPVFSLDLKTAIVSVEFNGFSMDSYYRQVYILRQTKDGWQIMRTKTIAMA